MSFKTEQWCRDLDLYSAAWEGHGEKGHAQQLPGLVPFFDSLFFTHFLEAPVLNYPPVDTKTFESASYFTVDPVVTLTYSGPDPFKHLFQTYFHICQCQMFCLFHEN